MITRGMITPAGVFLKPHGVKGEIGATFYDNVDTSRLKCLVVEVDGLYVPFFTEGMRSRGGDNFLLTIDGITTDEEAKLLARKPLFLLNDDPALTPDDLDEGLCAGQLVGFRAFEADGSEIGTIEDIEDSTANVLFVISRADGTDVLVPVVDEFIVDIDTENATITFQLPDGLI